MKTKETEKRAAKGVYVRTWKSGKQTIRVEFCYRQKLCRETLQLDPTAENIKKAVALRKTILGLIALGEFNYAEFFPHSKSAIKFGHALNSILIKELLDQFLIKAEKRVVFTTYDRYKRICDKQLYPKFGNLPISELNAGIIWDWLEKFKCQRKTIVNMLTPLRAIVADALIYGLIEKNPFTLIDTSRLNKFASDYFVNPFNQNEIKEILTVADGQIKNLFQFAFFTGLRTSELIGLRWEDVDWKKKLVHVRRAVVNGKEKTTKTKSSVRYVYLVPSALKALRAQREYTYFLGGRVFYNPFNHRPWQSSDQLRKRAWVPLFKKVEVPYRNLYQTRHTFASMMASGGENFMWVSNQMGHETSQTTARFYARWLPNPNIPGGYKPLNRW